MDNDIKYIMNIEFVCTFYMPINVCGDVWLLCLLIPQYGPPSRGGGGGCMTPIIRSKVKTFTYEHVGTYASHCPIILGAIFRTTCKLDTCGFKSLELNAVIEKIQMSGLY